MANQLISEMQNGDVKSILQGLDHQGAIYRMNAIGFAALNKIAIFDVLQKIQLLKNDDVQFDGYTVSDFAIAALDILKVEKYAGAENQIKALIESGFDFLR